MLGVATGLLFPLIKYQVKRVVVRRESGPHVRFLGPSTSSGLPGRPPLILAPGTTLLPSEAPVQVYRPLPTALGRPIARQTALNLFTATAAPAASPPTPDPFAGPNFNTISSSTTNYIRSGVLSTSRKRISGPAGHEKASAVAPTAPILSVNAFHSYKNSTAPSTSANSWDFTNKLEFPGQDEAVPPATAAASQRLPVPANQHAVGVVAGAKSLQRGRYARWRSGGTFAVAHHQRKLCIERLHLSGGVYSPCQHRCGRQITVHRFMFVYVYLQTPACTKKS